MPLLLNPFTGRGLYYHQLIAQPVVSIVERMGVGNAEFHSCMQTTGDTCKGHWPHKANMDVKPCVNKLLL